MVVVVWKYHKYTTKEWDTLVCSVCAPGYVGCRNVGDCACGCASVDGEHKWKTKQMELWGSSWGRGGTINKKDSKHRREP